MSIATDVRSYAETALEQGKQAVDTVQTRITEVRGDATEVAEKLQGSAREFVSRVQDDANEFAGRVQTSVTELTGRANSAYGDVLTRAETLLNNAKTVDFTVAGRTVSVQAVTDVVEPYVNQVLGYRTAAQERADEVLADLRKDPRVARVIEAANTVVETVQVRVVKPVSELIAKSPLVNNTVVKSPVAAAKPVVAAAAPAKAAVKRVTAKATPAKKAPAKAAVKATPTKPATIKAAAAKKAPAKRTAK
jgi:hypothetical protein